MSKPLVTEFNKAVRQLSLAIEQPKNEFIRDSVIRRLKFCVELAWKTSKKIMGATTVAPKDVIREMAQSGYIDDVELWLQSIDQRNLSSHAYKEEIAERVYNFACLFLPYLEKLNEKLDSK